MSQASHSPVRCQWLLAVAVVARAVTALVGSHHHPDFPPSHVLSEYTSMRVGLGCDTYPRSLVAVGMVLAFPFYEKLYP